MSKLLFTREHCPEGTRVLVQVRRDLPIEIQVLEWSVNAKWAKIVSVDKLASKTWVQSEHFIVLDLLPGEKQEGDSKCDPSLEESE